MQSNLIENVICLRYNAFTMAPVLMSFYLSCTVAHNNVLLFSIILPLISSNKGVKELLRMRKGSRLYAWIKDDKLPMAGFENRMESWKQLSLASFQYSIDMEWCEVDEQNNVKVTDKFKQSEYAQPIHKNAKNLSNLFNGMTVEDIFVTLGIREL